MPERRPRRLPPPRLSDLRPDLPDAFDGVFATALAKSPEMRYATCGELVQAAHPATNAGPVAFEAGPRRAAQRAGKSLEQELGSGAAVIRRADDVQHHLHARADALDEVLLGDEITTPREIDGKAAVGGEDRLGSARRPDGSRERHLDRDEQADRRPAG